MATKTKTKKPVRKASKTAAPVKKQLTKAQKLQREIARRNRAYAKASPAQKRVLIAKDVIAQVEANRFVAEQGCWTDTWVPSSLAVQNDASFQKTFLDNPQLSCSCCAVGSLFLGCTLYANQVPYSEIEDNWTLGDRLFYRRDKFANGFDKLFSNAQLGLIETAFEGSTGFLDTHPMTGKRVGVTEAQVEAAHAFYNNHFYSSERLVGIMTNIVKNKGAFKP